MVVEKSIAILFFSRLAPSEAQQKNWLQKRLPKGNQSLAEALIENTWNSLKSTQLPVFHFHENNQVGHSFGERLANAYQDLYNQGYSAVIAIGNDSPEIYQTDWDYVIEQLQSGQNVLGPSLRGGSYLIGLQKESFEKSSFSQLPWQSQKLYQKLKGLCGFNTAVLKTLRDLNTYHDLKKFLVSGKSNFKLKQVIKIILTSLKPFEFKAQAYQVTFFIRQNIPFRAPPVLP